MIAITPQSDYESWAMIISSSIEPLTEYHKMLEPCTQMIDQIIKNRTLDAPIANKTNSFINQFVPSICDSILQLPNLQNEELKHDLEFLENALKLSIWGITADQFALYNVLLNLLTKSKLFYQKNPITFSRISEIFMKSNAINDLSERIQRANINVRHFDLFLNIIIKMKLISNKQGEYKNEIALIFTAFIEYILKKEEFYQNEVQYISTIMQYLLDLIAKEFPEGHFANEYINIITKANDLINDQNKINQLCGISIINGIPDDLLLIGFVDNDMINTITKRKFDDNFYTILNHVLPKLFKSEAVDLDGFNLLFSNLPISAFSESFSVMPQDMLNSFMNISSKLDADSLKSFIQSQSQNQELCEKILSKLFDNMSPYLVSLFDNALTKDNRKFLFEITLSKQFNQYSISVLKRLIETSDNIYFYYRDDFTKKIIDEMRSYSELKPALYELLFKYKVATKFQMTELAQYLAEIIGVDDFFWKLLADYYHNIVSEDFSTAFLQTINNCIKAYDIKKASKSYADFIIIFFKLRNQSYYNLQILNASRIEVNKTKFEEMVMLGQLFAQCQNESVKKQIGKFILDLFIDTKDQDAPKNMCDFCTAWITNEEEGNHRERFISLLIDYINEIESKFSISIFGIQRHSDKKKWTQVKIKFPLEPPVILDVSPSLSMDKLVKVVAMKRKKPSNVFEFPGNKKFKMDQTLEMNSIKDGDLIEMKEKELITFNNQPKQSFENLPTYILSKNEIFSIFLINLLDEDEEYLVHPSWKLLKLLPDNENIINDVTISFNFINEVQTGYKYRYYMNIFNRILKKDPTKIEQFQKSNSFHILVNNVLDFFNDDVKCTYEIMDCLDITFSANTVKETKLFPFLIKLFNQIPTSSNHYAVSQSLFIKAITTSPQLLSSLLGENINEISEIYLNFSFDQAKRFLSVSNDCKALLPIIEYLVSKKEFKNCSLLFEHISDEQILRDWYSRITQNLDHKYIQAIVPILQTIVNKCPNILEENSSINEEILSCLTTSTSEQELSAIYKLVNLFKLTDQACDNIIAISQIDIQDIWNYDHEFFERRKFTGLKNLGATCYMNSVLQQLFHCKLFINELYKQPMQNKCQSDFLRIMCSLELTNRKFVETQEFCNEFNPYFDPRRQEDAVEFYNVLLDKLPEETTHFFKGEINNHLEGVDAYYNTNICETFYHISVVVKGCANLNQSLMLFQENQLLTDDNKYFADSLNKKISVRKRVVFAKLPQVLVIHLQRFEFLKQQGFRVKLNDHFEFPNDLTLNETEYRLSGVLLHNGTAEGGHYISIIKIESKWYKFDDQEVAEFPESMLGSESYGGKAGMCAYLLFYTQINVVDPKPQVPKDVSQIIEEDNTSFNNVQNMFSDATLEFAMGVKNDDFILAYFFGIYARAKVSEKQHQWVKERLLSVNSKVALSYVNEQKETILLTFRRCSQERVINLLIEFLQKVLITPPPESHLDFVNSLIVLLYELVDYWRQFPSIGRLLFKFVNVFRDFSIEQQLFNQIIDFIRFYYSENRSSIALNNVDFSYLIKSIENMINTETAPMIKCIFEFMAKIKCSPHNKNAFNELLMRLVQYGGIEYTDIDDDLLIQQIFIINFKNAKTNNEVLDLLENCNKSGKDIMKPANILNLCLTKFDEMNEQVTKFNYILIFKPLLSGNANERQAIEKVIETKCNCNNVISKLITANIRLVIKDMHPDPCMSEFINVISLFLRNGYLSRDDDIVLNLKRIADECECDDLKEIRKKIFDCIENEDFNQATLSKIYG